MKLVIVHCHYRPGGVRRVIEQALPYVALSLQPSATQVLLVGGEAPDEGWLGQLRRALREVDVACAIEPALGYLSEQRGRTATLTQRTRAHLRRWLTPDADGPCVVWAHNPALGRNLILVRELTAICAVQGARLVYHHHDWWFDNRWARWREMSRAGFRTLAAVARTTFPLAAGVRHAAINHEDSTRLRRHLGARAAWLPNLVLRAAHPSAARERRARQWLADQLGDRAPVWLAPCRLLRRKNLAEALLLTRWLRPDAWLVTTGGVSSADESAYGRVLGQAARRHGWRLRLGVLAPAGAAQPAVDDLMAASEVILLTSLQEGFGLPNLEAAAAGRPLIARTLPNIAPDLARFGFRFPQAYADVQVDVGLFDLRPELERQAQRWRAWRAQLPSRYRALAGQPPLLRADARAPSLAFSRLTLTAQLEVLAHPPAYSWERCAPLNPFLARWRLAAGAGRLASSGWPKSAAKTLGGPAYARRFTRLLRPRTDRPPPLGAAMRATEDFIRAKLSPENQYPLLWTRGP